MLLLKNYKFKYQLGKTKKINQLPYQNFIFVAEMDIKHVHQPYLVQLLNSYCILYVYPTYHFRITGLDPANPPFFPAILLDHLSHRDAVFVDIIHTDAGLYGQPYSTGTTDFWPNDGKC